MNSLQNVWETIKNNAENFIALILLVAAAFAITYLVEKKARQADVEKYGRCEAMLSVRKITIIGVFSAVSFVLMMFKFPLPFAPAFYTLDFSDVPALIGGFAAGPLVGVMIEFIKNLLNLLIQGTTTGFVGEIANFIVGASLILPATIIYRFKKSRKIALISCLVGTACITIVGALLNAFFLLPAYAALFGSGIDAFVSQGAAINPLVSNIFTFCALCVAPFNLIKGAADSAITFLLYKQLSPILKSEPSARRRKNAAGTENI